MNIDNIESIHNEAQSAAQQASKMFADKYFDGSDGGPCGFAWVNVYKVRSNSKLGRTLVRCRWRRSVTWKPTLLPSLSKRWRRLYDAGTKRQCAGLLCGAGT